MLKEYKAQHGYSQYFIELTKIEILLDIRKQNELIIEYLKNME